MLLSWVGYCRAWGINTFFFVSFFLHIYVVWVSFVLVLHPSFSLFLFELLFFVVVE